MLDIGCGNGQTSRDAARAASEGGRVLGIDLSGPMLAKAAQLARDEGISNVRFEQADAQVHAFEAGAFDLAISRFGVMFFEDPVAAFANIAVGPRRFRRPTGHGHMAVAPGQRVDQQHRGRAGDGGISPPLRRAPPGLFLCRPIPTKPPGSSPRPASPIAVAGSERPWSVGADTDDATPSSAASPSSE